MRLYQEAFQEKAKEFSKRQMGKRHKLLPELWLRSRPEDRARTMYSPQPKEQKLHELVLAR